TLLGLDDEPAWSAELEPIYASTE
ncbi:MAG: hypothetical protein JWN14_2832, partial [Chthonomonadales bacterium]|nr:hypothetical protein [Chthonomonadales bacterium]